jgi:hypothetical protein
MTENSANRNDTGLRSLLWVVLAVSAVANAVTSSVGGPLLVSTALGVVALASATALVVRHYRRRG